MASLIGAKSLVKSPKLMRKKSGGDFCCVPGCGNSRIGTLAQGKKVSYYRFPCDEERKQRWLTTVRYLKGSNWDMSKHSRICSEHFVSGVPNKDPDHEDFVPSVFGAKKTGVSSKDPNDEDLVPPVEKTETTTKKPVKRKLSMQTGRPKKETLITPQPSEHDYIKTQESKQERARIEEAEKLVPGFIENMKKKEELQCALNTSMKKNLSLDTIKDDDVKCKKWTGFPTFSMFVAVFMFLEPKAATMTIWRGNVSTSESPGPVKRRRTLSLMDEFFLTMVRLKAGLHISDLAHRFSVSEGTVSATFNTWLNLMYLEFKNLMELPDPDVLWANKSEAFDKFSNTNLIVDCTEIFCESPSDLTEKKQLYSDYKHHQTFKFLVAISAHPAVVYVSEMHGGRASDMFITAHSQKFIEASQLMGGKVMADRGFTGTYKMTPVGIEFVTPVFKGIDRCQLSSGEVEMSAECSSARIHVERIMQRIKIYRILEGDLRLSMRYSAEQIFTVCAYLTNFQSPILKK